MMKKRMKLVTRIEIMLAFMLSELGGVHEFSTPILSERI
jgi:hypothetical protein